MTLSLCNAVPAPRKLLFVLQDPSLVKSSLYWFRLRHFFQNAHFMPRSLLLNGNSGSGEVDRVEIYFVRILNLGLSAGGSVLFSNN